MGFLSIGGPAALFPGYLCRVLEELPKPLDETYKRILRDINNSNQKQAHRVLQCLAVANRPLRVEELAEVLALDFIAGGIPKFNADWRWEDHEKRCCRPVPVWFP